MDISASNQIRSREPTTNTAFVLTTSTDRRVLQTDVDGYITSGMVLVSLSDLGLSTGIARRDRGVELTFFGVGSAGDAFSYNVWMAKYGQGVSTDPSTNTKDIELRQIATGAGVLVNVAGAGANTCVKSTELCGGVLTLTKSTAMSVFEGVYGSPGADVHSAAGEIGRLVIPETFGAAFLLIDMTRTAPLASVGVIYEIIE